VERVLSESGEPSGQGFASAFRDSGAIGKGVKDGLGRGGAVIVCSTSAISKIFRKIAQESNE
jgi:hypothetical protein